MQWLFVKPLVWRQANQKDTNCGVIAVLSHFRNRWKGVTPSIPEFSFLAHSSLNLKSSFQRYRPLRAARLCYGSIAQKPLCSCRSAVSGPILIKIVRQDFKFEVKIGLFKQLIVPESFKNAGQMKKIRNEKKQKKYLFLREREAKRAIHTIYRTFRPLPRLTVKPFRWKSKRTYIELHK